MKKIHTLLLALLLGATSVFSQPCSISSTPLSPGSNNYMFTMNGNWSPVQYLILWNFGDGSWGFGPSANHTYNINGTFLVNMTIRLFTDTTNVLCSAYDSVSISGLNPAPCAITTYPDSSGTGTIGFFANNVTPGNTISWTFGDGGSGTGSPISHTYNQTGYYAVTMSSGVPGTTGFCTVTDSIYAYVNASTGCPFSYFTNSNSQFAFYPLNTALPGNAYYIEYGDGNNASNNTGQFTHGYSNPGMYTVMMYTFQGGDTCISSLSIEVSPSTIDSNSCAITVSPLGSSLSYLFSLSGVPAYATWTVYQANTILDTNITMGSNSFGYTFPAEGIYQISVNTVDSAGATCNQTITINAIDSTAGPACNISYNVSDPINNVYVFNTNNLNDSYWEITMDSMLVDTITTSSGFLLYQFTSPGNYIITQTSIDSITSQVVCTSSLFLTVGNNPPSGNCSSDFEVFQNGLTGFFIETGNYDPTITNYFWSFGDGSSSTEHYPYHTYSNNGMYQVSLYISNAVCQDTIMQMISISNTPPDSCNAYFVVTQSAPNTLTLVSPSGNFNSGGLLWNFNGITSTAPFPSLIIPYNSINLICLSINQGNCVSTYCDTIFLDSLGNLNRMASTNVLINVLSPQNITGYSVTTGIKKDSFSQMAAYPNPFDHELMIENNQFMYNYYRVYGIDGKLIDSGNLQEGVNRLNGDTWASGTYFLEMRGLSGDIKNLKIRKN